MHISSDACIMLNKYALAKIRWSIPLVVAAADSKN